MIFPWYATFPTASASCIWAVWLNLQNLTSFARIRSIGSDYARTSRQRQVLEAMLRQARGVKNPVVLIDFFKTAFAVTETNVFWPQMAALGVFALVHNDVGQLRLPADGTFEAGTFDGTWCIRPDLAANRLLLDEFLQY